MTSAWVKVIKEEKSNAELVALKGQISPHFLFNTLNSLNAVIRTEEKEHGIEFVEKLAEVYRYILDSRKHDLITVEKEVDFINSYTYLLNKRFGDKLIINIELTQANIKATIPPMSIQLLLENAVQHNSITASTPLTIKVSEESGYICVENNLQPKAQTESFGIGLPNLSKRYQLLLQKEIQIVQTEDKFSVKLPIEWKYWLRKMNWVLPITCAKS